jgi:hypothetical protein
MARNIRFLTQVFGAVALIAITVTPALAQLSFPAAQNKDGSPDRRRGAGSRSAGCVAGETPQARERTLFAIVPQANKSLTTEAYPDFFWYAPPLTSDAEVEFTLVEAATGESIYNSVFRSDRKEGIARLSLPAGLGSAGLEVGKEYTWSVQLNCSPGTADGQVPVKLTSTIQRVALSESVASQLKVASSLGQAEVFAENGLWNDSLSALADSLCDAANRDAGLKAWTTLFQSVELNYFTQVPMLADCDCACN